MFANAFSLFFGNLYFVLPVLFFVYLGALCVYRLYFHPYAKYPGPLLAKLTNLYGLYHAYKGDMHLDVWRCHEIYGDYVRYAPDRVCINTNDAIKDIYGHGRNVQKSQAYGPLPIYSGAFNTHTAIDKTIHGRKRRIVSQGFSDAALRAAEPFILDKVQKLCNGLLSTDGITCEKPTDGWTKPRDVSKWCTYMTVDVISELSFGKSLDMLQKADNRWITESISSYIRRSFMAMQYPTIFTQGGSSWLSADTWLFPRLLKDRARYLDATIGVVQRRIDDNESIKDRKDIMSYLLAAKDPETGENLQIAEVWSEAYLMISAGGDTTATAIAATFFYLSRNPEALQKVTAEIRTTFESFNSVVQGQALNSCIYLRACLEEAMRMSPSAPGVFWREVLPGGAPINGEHMPAGYDVGTGIYAVHHNPLYYPNPFIYNPSRWLIDPDDPSSEARVNLARSAFIPFSHGPRACVARPLAYLEMALAVARVLWIADLRAAGGEEGKVGEGHPKLGWGRHRVEEYQLIDQMTSAKEGPFLEFRKRDCLEA